MKRLFILLFACVFFVIGACGSKGKQTGTGEKDVIAELLKENLLGGSTNTNLISGEESITEAYSNTNVVEELSSSSVSSTEAVGAEKKEIKDEGIKIKERKEDIRVKGESYIKVGNDTPGQVVSPRKFLKLTFAVFSKSRNISHVDFYVYALPRGQKVFDSKYLITVVKNVEFINGQAQLTKYWNARNVEWDFLPQGEYNIYLKCFLKNSEGKIIQKVERYWGGEKEFYLKLY